MKVKMLNPIAQEPLTHAEQTTIRTGEDKCIHSAETKCSAPIQSDNASSSTTSDLSTAMQLVKSDSAPEEATHSNCKGISCEANQSPMEESSTAEATFSSSCSSAEIHEVPCLDIVSDDGDIGSETRVAHTEAVYEVNMVTEEPEKVVFEEEEIGVSPGEEAEHPIIHDRSCTDPEIFDVPPPGSLNTICADQSKEQPNFTVETEKDLFAKDGKPVLTIPIDTSNGTPQLSDTAELFNAATKTKGEVQKTDIPGKELRVGGSTDLLAVAIHLPTTNQVTFEPFDSLKFTKIRKISCMEKVKNVHAILQRICKLVNTMLPVSTYISIFMYLILFVLIIWKKSGGTVGGLFEKLVIIAFVILAVKVLDFALNVWYGVSMEPLNILIEACDIMGDTKRYLITDKRSRLSRALNWRAGGQMEIVYAKNPNVLLWKTRATGFLGPSRIVLERSLDDAVFASYELYKCCGEAQEDKFAWWKLLCGNQLVTTVKTPLCGGFVSISQPICGERNEGNLIERSEGLYTHQLAVRKNAFSYEDLISELFDFGVEDVAGEAAAFVYDTATEAVAIKEEAKDAFEMLKEKGYQKLQTSEAVWDVKFRPGMTEDQKAAVVLYVIKQYTVQ